MYRFVSHSHPEYPDQLDSHAAWRVVDSPEVARAFFVNQKKQSSIPTLYFYDNDVFFNGLTALHIPTDGPPQQVEGPNALIFGDDPVQVIVDLARIPQPLSALNGLFDDPNPHYQGRPLGPRVKLLVFMQKTQLIGESNDCYSRMTNVLTNPLPNLVDPWATIPKIQVSEIPDGAEVVEFHGAPSWQDSLLGHPKSNESGIPQFQYSPWIHRLQENPDIPLVLKNAPTQDLGLRAFLAQLVAGPHSAMINGQWVRLPHVTVMVCNGYTEREQEFLDSHLRNDHVVAGPSFTVNAMTIDDCFSSITIPPTGNLIVSTGFLGHLKKTGGTLIIQGPLTNWDTRRLRFEVANHNAISTKPINLITQSQVKVQTDSLPNIQVTNDIAMAERREWRSSLSSLDIVVPISTSTRLEDLLGSLTIQSFSGKQFNAAKGLIQRHLEDGHRIILTSLESNPAMTQYLSSLFEPPPYLWVNGQRHDYAPSQVICISATAPAHLHSAPQSVSYSAPDYLEECLNLLGSQFRRHDSTLRTWFDENSTIKWRYSQLQTIVREANCKPTDTSKEILFKLNDALSRTILSTAKTHLICGSIDKQTALKNAIHTHPIVILEGPPGSSKTHWAEDIGEKMGQVWSITTGPDFEPDQWIGRRILDGDRMVFQAGPIAEWARARPAPGKFATIVINEADTAPNGTWNFLLPILSTATRQLPVDGGPVPLRLTPRHRVIITQNGIQTEGRVTHTRLIEAARTLYFAVDTPDQLLNEVVLPLMEYRGVIDSAHQTAIWETIQMSIPDNPSIRDYLDTAEQVIQQVVHPAANHYIHDQLEALQAKYPDFDFTNPATQLLARTLLNRLALAAIPGFQGKRGIIIEGAPGQGKDGVIDRVCPEATRLMCSIGDDYFEMAKDVKASKEAGQQLVVSELDLLPSAIAEGLLNDALSGNKHPRFFLFVTINGGRHPFSAPFKNRLDYIQAPQFLEADEQRIVNARLTALAPHRDGTQMATNLVRFHHVLISELNRLNIHILPTPRELFKCADRIGNGISIATAINRTYGLHRQRLGIDDLFPLFPVPPKPVIKPISIVREPDSDSDSTEVSSDLSESSETKSATRSFESPFADTTAENPSVSPQTEVSSGSEPQTPVQDPSPIDQSPPPHLSHSVGESPPPHLSHSVGESNLPAIRFIRNFRGDQVDTRGEATQTEETVAKAPTYFRFHDDVPLYKRSKREDRIDVYTAISEDGRIMAHMPLKRRLKEIVPATSQTELIPLDPTEIVSTIDLQASTIWTSLPSRSPNETIVSYQTDTGVKLKFYTDLDTCITYIPPLTQACTLNYKLKLPSDDKYRYLRQFNQIPSPPAIQAPSIPQSLKTLFDAMNVATIVGIDPADTYGIKLEKITHYCARFTQGRIPDELDPIINRALASDVFERAPRPHDQLCTIANILVRRTGVCRHRSWVFLALSGYFQVESRIIGNNIHNIIELNDYHGGTQNYVKAEISEFGFRRINFDSDALSKNRINEIRDNYIIDRHIPRPTPTRPVDPNDPDSITELEALILSPHLGPKTRQRELTYFCEHMLNCGRLPGAKGGLDPESIRFEMPTEFDDVIVNIIAKATDDWADSTKIFYRERWGESAKTLQFFSNHLCQRNELRHPIAHFYTQLLQNLESTTHPVTENEAITIMDIIFTMPKAHYNHLNTYTIVRQAFDQFLASPHAELFKERVANHLYKTVRFDENALISTDEIGHIKVSRCATQLIESNFTDDNAFTQWIHGQSLLLLDSRWKSDPDAQAIHRLNQRLLELTTDDITKEVEGHIQRLTESATKDTYIMDREIIKGWVTPIIHYAGLHLTKMQSSEIGDIINLSTAQNLFRLVMTAVTHPATIHFDHGSPAKRAWQQWLTHFDSDELDTNFPALRINGWLTAHRSSKHGGDTLPIPELTRIVRKIIQPTGCFFYTKISPIYELTTRVITSQNQFRHFEADIMPRLQKAIAGNAELSGVLAYTYLNLAKHYGLTSELSPGPTEFFNLFDSPGPLHTWIIFQLIDVSPQGKSLVAESLSRLSPSTWTIDHSSFWKHMLCNTTHDDDSAPATVTIDKIAQNVLTDGANNPIIWAQFAIDYSPHEQAYTSPIVKTYLETMLSRRIPYAGCRGFKEYPGWDIVLTDKAAQSLHTPRSERYSWTKGTSIDYQRYIGGKPFLKSTHIQRDSKPKVIITQSLSSYFSHKQKLQYNETHLIESVASTLWRQYEGNITIATFWGTETPQTFVDFAKIVEFLENHPHALPLRPKQVLQLYPGSLRLIPPKDS